MIPSAVRDCRTVGSRVANSAFWTITSASVSRLSRDDLPAFVYPTIATEGMWLRERFFRFVSRAGAMPAI